MTTLVQKGGMQIAAAIDSAAMIAVDAVSLETSQEAIRTHLLADEAVVKAQLFEAQAAVMSKSMSEWMAMQEKVLRKLIKNELTKKRGATSAENDDSDEDD